MSAEQRSASPILHEDIASAGAPPLADEDQARADFYALFARLLLAPPDAALLAALAGAEPIAAVGEFALEDAWLPVALVPQLDREAAEGSLYELLERLDLLPTEGVEVVTAALPSAEEVEMLEIAPTYPVLRLSRTAVSDGVPVEFSRVTFPADRYELTFPLAERLTLPLG